MGDYPELCSYANIKYTPAWYYKEFPGFFNVESYRILANWTEGVRNDLHPTPSLMQVDELSDEDTEGAPETKESDYYENKKRKLEDEKRQDGIHGEFQRTYPESNLEFSSEDGRYR